MKLGIYFFDIVLALIAIALFAFGLQLHNTNYMIGGVVFGIIAYIYIVKKI